MQRTKNVLEELKMFSKKMKINFDKRWFNVVWITKEQEILTEYLSDCRDLIYEKYGHKISERIKNLKKFYGSEEYGKCVIRYGGQVISKKSFSKFREVVNKLDDKRIKNILLDFCDRIEKNIGNANKIAALTETKVKAEKENLINSILRHEWIHILLEENNIHSKNWKYNEGLTTYFEFYLDNKLETLEECSKRQKNSFGKQYFVNAIMFRDLLKDISDRNKIKKIRNNL